MWTIINTFFVSPVDCQKELLADVIFLVQCTSQIRSPEFQKNILNFLISVVNSTQVSDNLIRIGVIVYSDTPSQFTLNQYSSKHQVLDSIKNLRYSTGNANTAKALEYSLAYFNEERGGRQKRGIPQMLYLITDGPARDKNNLKARAEEYAAKHIQVYGIGVANAKRSELEIITKNKNNVFQVDNYKALQGLQNNISGTLCNMSKPGKIFCTRVYFCKSVDETVQTFLFPESIIHNAKSSNGVKKLTKASTQPIGRYF